MKTSNSTVRSHRFSALVKAMSFWATAVLAVSCSTKYSDTYPGYVPNTSENALCVVQVCDWPGTSRNGPIPQEGAQIVEVDGQRMRTAKLIRLGETEPRFLGPEDDFEWNAFEGHTGRYAMRVCRAELPPGEHNLEIEVATDLYNGDNLVDHIKLIHWSCRVGVSYQFYFAVEGETRKEGQYRFWIESSDQKIWEAVKSRSAYEFIFNMSK